MTPVLMPGARRPRPAVVRGENQSSASGIVGPVRWLLARRNRPVLVGLAFVVAGLSPLVVGGLGWETVSFQVTVFAATSLGWNLLGGYGGQISFSYAVYFAAGAYGAGVSVTSFHASPWVGIGAGVAIACLIALITGLPLFRLRTHYYSIATLAILEVTSLVVSAASPLGASGGLEIPITPYGLGSLEFSPLNATPFFELGLGLLGVTLLGVWWILRTRTGLYLRAIRDDPVAAEAFGIRTTWWKAVAAVVSCIPAPVAGGLYAMAALFVDPNTVLSIPFSVLIVLVAVLGGLGTLWGPVVGAALVITLQQNLALDLPGQASGLEPVIYGIVIILVGMFFSQGILAARPIVATALRRAGARVKGVRPW